MVGPALRLGVPGELTEGAAVAILESAALGALARATVICGVTTGLEASFTLPHAYHFGISLLGVAPYHYGEFQEMLSDYYVRKVYSRLRTGVMEE